MEQDMKKSNKEQLGLQEDQNEQHVSHTKPRHHKKSALDFRKYTKQIWLAGLGAFSRAEEEGNKLFDSLVKVGEELESKTVEVTDQTVNKVSEKTKESVTETKDKVEKLLDHGVNHSLNRIGLVTAKDLQHLENLIMQLHHKVDALVEENQNLREQLLKK
ncbi:phasin family protein [Acinetobacter bereziniae]|uniref:Phasin family protein n=1 Tax=Acinetobacter bereziniae TaxID=106648 RepID=A0A8I1DIS4_ACIBZ|nr:MULTISPECIES: phasin family protein [Acinetobacter]MBJ8421323.1 phasin family protein [Acinetobacter bereziniae]MBJ9949923.1 phasin family protein [Acinetobacter bereziniae]MCU4473658.1 phasin family protein [Acinetobacter bereziniae]MCU4540009.1 phasin family protein [Acinetobacter bereziniae]MCU4627133.1 phasin family protein [Acinetobacter bereziniae]